MSAPFECGRIIRLKRRINACALVIIALLFSTLAAAAPSAEADNERIAQALDLLGLRALLEQAPAVLAVAAEAEAQFQQTPASAAKWRRELEAQLKPQLLSREAASYLRERYRADTFQQAQQRLAEPIAKRARYFDLAMTQPGAEKNLRDFLTQSELPTLHNGLNQTEVTQSAPLQANSATAASGIAARRALLMEIDAATASSLLTATLQSAIAARVRQAAGSGGVDAGLLSDEIAERQRYLAPLAVEYLLYDYRYLRDDELRAYRDLLRDEAVQWLLDVGRQAVLHAIVGEVTPPSVPPR